MYNSTFVNVIELAIGMQIIKNNITFLAARKKKLTFEKKKWCAIFPHSFGPVFLMVL